ncbi:hypothetical protein C8N43_3339 [Litoreibacter ponti]|uniref:Uncharacterized protein n=1 Tax=Litoreibacter ponti TaxID=1510457 RepID=A0A2T6BER6_9RHOB|nr:hypothetical protein [Litoreibacter ponti]PTX54524.1 hypothetical protein C8N43_3339 [Litoreibacter ponti]
MADLGILISAVVLLAADAVTDDAAAAFKDLGFEPDIVAERTLLISGSEVLFESRFDTDIFMSEDGLRSLNKDASPLLARSLPVDALAPELRRRVMAIEFEASRDFGPVSFDQATTSSGQEAAMPTISAAVILKNPTDTQTAADGFGQLGFEVATISDGVLLLTGEVPVFEKGFGTDLTVDEAGAQRNLDGEMTRSLPMESLPTSLRDMVSEAEFEAPPDFGPGNF